MKILISSTNTEREIFAYKWGGWGSQKAGGVTLAGGVEKELGGLKVVANYDYDRAAFF